MNVLCAASHSWYVWVGFIGLIFAFLVLDLGVFHKKTHAVSMKEALIWAAVWFVAAMLFNLWVLFECGKELGLQFFTGYLIEKSLSVDNLFVILLIFTSFGIPKLYQHRVLFWGILGALVMRGVLITLGAALIARFDWIFYLFGIFLVWTGSKMYFENEEKFDHEKSIIVRIMRRIVPVAKGLRGEHFFVRQKGRVAVTVLFVALIVVEVSDVIFAFDSIPAIFAISSDPFIVFSSNVFAILGLRSLYFVIAKAHDLFTHLKTGLSVILVFIGAKLLVKDIYHIPILLSLGIVMGILAIAITVSIIMNRQEKKSPALRKKRHRKRKK